MAVNRGTEFPICHNFFHYMLFLMIVYMIVLRTVNPIILSIFFSKKVVINESLTLNMWGIVP